MVTYLLSSLVNCENRGPILTGDGKELVSEDILKTVHQLVHAVAGEKAEIWMLDCKVVLIGRGVNRIEAYLRPRINGARILRGYSILCLKEVDFAPGPKDLESRNGWYCPYPEPKAYAVVSLPDKPFSEEPTGDRELLEAEFSVIGTVADADIVEVTDRVRAEAKGHRISTLLAKTDHEVVVRTLGHVGGGNGWEFLARKGEDKWKIAKKWKWRD